MIRRLICRFRGHRLGKPWRYHEVGLEHQTQTCERCGRFFDTGQRWFSA